MCERGREPYQLFENCIFFKHFSAFRTKSTLTNNHLRIYFKNGLIFCDSESADHVISNLTKIMLNIYKLVGGRDRQSCRVDMRFVRN